jgi:hypothetical protein
MMHEHSPNHYPAQQEIPNKKFQRDQTNQHQTISDCKTKNKLLDHENLIEQCAQNTGTRRDNVNYYHLDSLTERIR